MTPVEIRALLLQRLHRTAERLPNGLLQRLVEDAVFFEEWNLKKRTARRSARVQQASVRIARADDKYWKDFRKRIG